MKIFTRSLLILSVLLLVLCYYIFEEVFHISFFPVVPAFLAYFIIVTSLTHTILMKISSGEGSSFVNGFMGILTGKMILSLFFLAIWIYNDEQGRQVKAVSFVCSYILYSSLELYFLVKHIKNK